ncbi:hypothetical protein VFPPC_16065 [Pochonia chlamydosporia 170]|uniref:Uncharacterized protein n=1 Tax=Pochonia chlamydosporia 170 TaxID=1380566 RepID=A0A179FP36_METCM|nr:hypothetical protein VFPPC_16065 [Pochonia chlamydosporia 170]OAQ66769.1 hypothetical protein VFPPC_16065 [Pochonia chlamydosporia 170]
MAEANEKLASARMVPRRYRLLGIERFVACFFDWVGYWLSGGSSHQCLGWVSLASRPHADQHCKVRVASLRLHSALTVSLGRATEFLAMNLNAVPRSASMRGVGATKASLWTVFRDGTQRQAHNSNEVCGWHGNTGNDGWPAYLMFAHGLGCVQPIATRSGGDTRFVSLFV